MEENKKIKIITPESALEKFLKWFDKNKRLAFIIVILVGIITHITMITETIMSQDGLWNSIDYSRPGAWEKTLGRWGIELIERFNYFISIPTVSTISCILVLAISAVLITDLFDFKSKISVIFTSLILVLTPTLTVTLIYIYTSFAYCFNFLISTLVVWFIYKFKYKKLGIFLSSLCFMLSLSIYQSYIGVSIGLCVMISIIHLLKNEKTIKEILINILKTASSVIIGGILYYIATMIILNISNLELSAYKGAQNISILGILAGLKTTILQTYKDFFTFFLGDTIIYNTNYRRELMYFVFFIVMAVSSIVALVSIKEDNKKLKVIRILLSVLFLILIPLALNIIDILIVGTQMYSLTTVQMILIIPFSFAIFEIINKGIILKWVAILSCVVIMGTYYIADNTSYAALKLTYNQAYSTIMRVMDRIETTEGYYKGYPIVFGGIIGNDNYPRNSALYTYTVDSIFRAPAFHGTYSGAIGTWAKFIRIFYGLDVPLASAEKYAEIVTSDEFKQMGIFPDEDSVKVIDGHMVVKFMEEPWLPF